MSDLIEITPGKTPVESVAHDEIVTADAEQPSPQPYRIPAARRSRQPVRPLTENDLPKIAELHRRVFPHSNPPSLTFLKQVFFELPWRNETVSSLAYEDASGRIVGCLGIMPREMRFRGRPVRAAVGSYFIVESSKKGTMAGLELTRQFFHDEYDLAIMDGTLHSRRLWEYLGGSVSQLYSFRWTRPLTVGGVWRDEAEEPSLLRRAVHASLSAFPNRRFRFHHPEALVDTLDTVSLLAYLMTFIGDRALQPVYDIASLNWLIQLLRDKSHHGALHQVAVRTESGRPLGWYLYDLQPNGVAEVLQLCGGKDAMPVVMDHLFYHAWQRGAIAATGSLDPSMCSPLSKNHCVFHQPEDSWMLIHSHDQEILTAIHAGDAFLTPLEAQRWIATG
jgi:GNAT acetyltransferase-like protein